MTIRTDAALTRRVTGARLVLSTAVLGGAFALAGLGAFGNLSDGGAPAATSVRHRDRGAVRGGQHPVGTRQRA